MRGHAGLADFEPHDGVEGRERRRAASSGRRARLSREGVDEIAADWVFTNGRILTLDRARPTAGALAVQGGRVVAVGRPPRRARLARSPHPRDRPPRCHRHPRSRRRPRPPGSRGPEADPSLAGPLPLDRRRADAGAPAGRGAQARRVDRDHAARRAAVLSRRAGVPRRGPLADTGRPRRRRARQSRVPARHLGLLEQAARLLRRQLGGAAARRRDARHGAASRRGDRRTPPASPPASSSSATSSRCSSSR